MSFAILADQFPQSFCAPRRLQRRTGPSDRSGFGRLRDAEPLRTVRTESALQSSLRHGPDRDTDRRTGRHGGRLHRDNARRWHGNGVLREHESPRGVGRSDRPRPESPLPPSVQMDADCRDGDVPRLVMETGVPRSTSRFMCDRLPLKREQSRLKRTSRKKPPIAQLNCECCQKSVRFFDRFRTVNSRGVCGQEHSGSDWS